MIVTIDPNPPLEKEKRVWNLYDRKDPNNSVNVFRMRLEKNAIDRWNIGIECLWDGSIPR